MPTLAEVAPAPLGTLRGHTGLYRLRDADLRLLYVGILRAHGIEGDPSRLSPTQRQRATDDS